MIAIVTGAGSGIGAAIADRIAAGGARVLAVDLRADGLARYDGSPQVATLNADVTAADAPEAIFAACRAEHGEPDVLVNNAGLGNAKPLHQSDDATLDLYLDVNLRSVIRLSRAFVTARGSAERAIVNVASVFGETGFPGVAAYAAAKAGVIGLTRQMVADYGPQGVRVNAVAPGLIATPATAERIASNAHFRRLTVGQIPAGRAGTPEEVAEVVWFLASPAAAYVSGTVLTVDGGWTACRYTAPE